MPRQIKNVSGREGSLRFRGGQVRKVQVNAGDISAKVEAQTSLTLNKVDALDWSEYYGMVAELLEPEQVP